MTGAGTRKTWAGLATGIAVLIGLTLLREGRERTVTATLNPQTTTVSAAPEGDDQGISE